MTDNLVQPYSVEAEHGVLGGLLIDNRAWDRIGDLVGEADFYRDDHRRIFRHVARLLDASKPADAWTVFESLQTSGEAEQSGGLAYLGEIVEKTPSAANIRRYAEIVVEKRLLRDLLSASSEILAIASRPSSDPAQERIDQALGLLMRLAESRPSQREPRDLRSILADVMGDIHDRFDRGGEITGLPTGFSDIDELTSGLQSGDLIVLAGRPAMGKTAIALNIAENVAIAGHTALVFSLEMGERQLAERSIASQGAVSMTRLRNGKLEPGDFTRISAGIARLMDARLMIDDSPALSVAQMRARARRVKRKHGLALVVIDYLQLMRGEGNNRNEEIGAVTRGLKLLARDLDVPVIVLSQLSRKVEERHDKRPIMSDLRESGSIEQDADIIAFVYRDEYYHKESRRKGVAELLVRKHRMGEIGDVFLTFQGEYSRFRDSDKQAIAEMLDEEKAKEEQPRQKKRKAFYCDD